MSDMTWEKKQTDDEEEEETEKTEKHLSSQSRYDM